MLLYWILLPIIWVLAHILFRFEVIGRENLKAVAMGAPTSLHRTTLPTLTLS